MRTTQNAKSEETISDVLRFLIKNSEKDVKTISSETGISANTIYSICSRNSYRADIRVLKQMADYFNVGLDIWLGAHNYVPTPTLTKKELDLVSTYQSLTDAAKERVEDYLSDVAGNAKNRKAV